MLSIDLGELWRSLKRKFFVCGGVAKGKTIKVVHDHGFSTSLPRYIS